jgi:hypothetical protein
MPALIERLEPGIYLSVWEGGITRENFLQRVHEREALVSQHGDAHYVAIVDMSSAEIKEYDIRTTRRSIQDSRLIAVFIISPPLSIRMMFVMLRQISAIPIELCESLEAAVEKAREALAVS